MRGKKITEAQANKFMNENYQTNESYAIVIKLKRFQASNLPVHSRMIACSDPPEQ